HLLHLQFKLYTFIIFFFSSRRRHTRSKRDWSSDVCSSDLFSHIRCLQLRLGALAFSSSYTQLPFGHCISGSGELCHNTQLPAAEIGRASCRERVCIACVGGGGGRIDVELICEMSCVFGMY